jgi:sterol desaturase/sphingolipid hydroxylase (fatty acid hydroxylase superfamily)
MTFGVISMAAAGVWLWTIVKGGDIALTSGELDLGVRYTSIVLLLLVAVALRGGYYVAEMLSHRKEWLDTL